MASAEEFIAAEIARLQQQLPKWIEYVARFPDEPKYAAFLAEKQEKLEMQYQLLEEERAAAGRMQRDPQHKRSHSRHGKRSRSRSRDRSRERSRSRHRRRRRSRSLSRDHGHDRRYSEQRRRSPHRSRRRHSRDRSRSRHRRRDDRRRSRSPLNLEDQQTQRHHRRRSRSRSHDWYRSSRPSGSRLHGSKDLQPEPRRSRGSSHGTSCSGVAPMQPPQGAPRTTANEGPHIRQQLGQQRSAPLWQPPPALVGSKAAGAAAEAAVPGDVPPVAAEPPAAQAPLQPGPASSASAGTRGLPPEPAGATQAGRQSSTSPEVPPDALVQSLSGMQGRLRLPAHIFHQNSIVTCHEVVVVTHPGGRPFGPLPKTNKHFINKSDFDAVARHLRLAADDAVTLWCTSDDRPGTFHIARAERSAAPAAPRQPRPRPQQPQQQWAGAAAAAAAAGGAGGAGLAVGLGFAAAPPPRKAAIRARENILANRPKDHLLYEAFDKPQLGSRQDRGGPAQPPGAPGSEADRADRAGDDDSDGGGDGDDSGGAATGSLGTPADEPTASQAAAPRLNRRMLRPPVPSGSVGIKVNMKEMPGRLYVSADATWLLWRGRRRPDVCTMIAHNPANPVPYQATDVEFRNHNGDSDGSAQTPFPGMESGAGWATIATFLGLGKHSLVGLHGSESVPDAIEVVKVSDGPSDWQPVRIPQEVKVPYNAAGGSSGSGSGTAPKGGHAGGSGGAASAPQPPAGRAAGGPAAEAHPRSEATRAPAAGSPEAAAHGFEGEAASMTPSCEYTLPTSLRRLLLPAVLLRRLPHGVDVPARLSFVMDQLPHEAPVPATYRRRRANCLSIQGGWRHVVAALGLGAGSRVWLQLRPTEASIHVRVLDNSDAAAGGVDAAEDDGDAADWDGDSDSAADDDDAAADEDMAAAEDPQVLGDGAADGAAAGAVPRTTAAGAAPARVAESQGQPKDEATSMAPSCEYTLPKHVGCLMLPSELVRRLPPAVDVPARLSFVMDQLPDEAPVPATYRRHRANCLRIEGGWAQVRRALDVSPGSRVWLQLRPAEGRIHVKAVSGPADGTGAALGGDRAAAADSGIDAAEDYSDSEVEDGAGDEGGAAVAGPTMTPAAVHAKGAAAQQTAATAPQGLPTMDFTLSPSGARRVLTPAALLHQLAARNLAVPARLAALLPQLPAEAPIPLQFTRECNCLRLGGGWSKVTRALDLRPGDRVRLQLDAMAGHLHVSKVHRDHGRDDGGGGQAAEAAGAAAQSPAVPFHGDSGGSSDRDGAQAAWPPDRQGDAPAAEAARQQGPQDEEAGGSGSAIGIMGQEAAASQPAAAGMAANSNSGDTAGQQWHAARMKRSPDVEETGGNTGGEHSGGGQHAIETVAAQAASQQGAEGVANGSSGHAEVEGAHDEAGEAGTADDVEPMFWE